MDDGSIHRPIHGSSELSCLSNANWFFLNDQSTDQSGAPSKKLYKGGKTTIIPFDWTSSKARDLRQGKEPKEITGRGAVTD